jgi:YjgF/chorismate_mutase-like, putative endoribonuclease
MPRPAPGHSSILSSVKQELGDLDRIKRVIRLFGMVNVQPGFDRMPEVIDGASDFSYEVFGPQYGKHARTAVGMAELPHGIPVEINGEFELKAKWRDKDCRRRFGQIDFRLGKAPTRRSPASASWDYLAGRVNGGSRRLSVTDRCRRHAKSTSARHLRTALLNCAEGAIANTLVQDLAPAQVCLGVLAERSDGDNNHGRKDVAHVTSLTPR